jgi:MFS family permease
MALNVVSLQVHKDGCAYRPRRRVHPARTIDHDLARGLHDAKSDNGVTSGDDQPSGLSVLLTCRPLLIFAGCAIMFHFANAAMLPLVGQKLALQDKNLGTSLMSACIVAAQIVMVPMAMLVGAKADAWGRKPLFLIALSVLTVRGCLYPLSDNPYWLVGVQLLDGVGAGIYGAIFPVIVADLMRGTGRFNVAQGAIITAQGIGAALSTTLAGIVVVHGGYSAAFLTLAGVAFVGHVEHARGSPQRLFALVYAVGTLVTVFLSNDATAVVLTPAVYAATRAAGATPLPYLLACAFIANAASFVLPISNPANLVIFDGHMPHLTAWLKQFGAPAIVSIAVTYLALRITQRSPLAQEKIAREFPRPRLAHGGRLTLWGIGAVAVALLSCSALDVQLGLPTFICGAATTAIVLALNRQSPWR